MTPPPADPGRPPSASRLKDLREAHGYRSPAELAKVTERLAAESPDEFVAISRTNLANMEGTRGVYQKDKIRATLAAAFGLSRDEFARYLVGDLSLDGALKLGRAAVGGAEPQPESGAVLPGGPLLRTHEHWADLCMAAMEADRSIKAETLRELGNKPFTLGDVNKVDAQLLLHLARGLQEWRQRRSR